MNTTSTVSLVSNGYTLSNAPNRLGGLTSSDPTRPPRELWDQFRAQGYLWLKNFLDRKEVLAFRGRYFNFMRESGLVAKDTDAVEGIYSSQPDGTELTRKLMAEFVRDAAHERYSIKFHRLMPVPRWNQLAHPGKAFKAKIIDAGEQQGQKQKSADNQSDCCQGR